MNEPVVVVGAGPVGLVLACELLQQDVPVRILDSSRGHSAHSRATVIWPRLLELLQRIGVSDVLAEEGQHIQGVTYSSNQMPLGTAWLNRLDSTPYPFAVGIPQTRTEDILERRLHELGGKVERGCTLTEIDTSGRLPVGRFVGSDGSTEDITASYLVGADGAHSTVRKLLDIPFDGDQLSVCFAITDAEVSGNIASDLVSYCYTPQGSLALGPLEAHVQRIAVSVPPGTQGESPEREFFQRIVAERGPGGIELGELRFSTTFHVNIRTAAHFQSGRCFLVGDAAHIMSPAGAQGMNTGLQDAVNLGWKLAAVARGQLAESGLRSYDVERHAAAHAVTRSTSLQTRWGFLRHPAQIALRDGIVRGADRVGVLQRRLAPKIGQLDATYNPVPVSRGEVRPGDRVPVVLGERHQLGGRWAGVSRDRWTVLMHAGRRRPDTWHRTKAAVCAAVGDLAEVLDAPSQSHGPLVDALGTRPVVAVVRPDGHLYRKLGADAPEAVAEAVRQARVDPSPTPKP
ncbi:FAD-dependent monooxygenase [Streptomyces alanosinicus]|uniref:Oxygenase n=1 Tax=Streptomyces alanosinicus TaxID=68171 RepID=A0A919D7A2_9ACTN|nr:FAD-dependent monooxygenase [Streptomyces alanosinicus]GHE12637.1 oxygenase [Streptomyces alanosinicus]